MGKKTAGLESWFFLTNIDRETHLIQSGHFYIFKFHVVDIFLFTGQIKLFIIESYQQFI